MLINFFAATLFSFFSISSAFGNSYSDGVEAYSTGNYKAAMEILMPLAEQGDIDSQGYIGLLYSASQGVKKDDELAASWYRKAAEKGHLLSIINLDLLYSQGRAGTDEEIASWYLNLAKSPESLETDHPGKIYVAAQYNIGLFYLEGRGVDKVPEEAVKWLMEAASNEFSSAKYVLAMEYTKGEVVEENMQKAFSLFEELAQEGDARSQYFLGLFYRDGEAVTQNYSEAFYWFKNSSEQGVANAQFELANMYAQGQGVDENLVIAYVLASLSAAQGHEGARDVRNIIVDYLSREQVIEGQRLAAGWELGTSLPAYEDSLTWP